MKLKAVLLGMSACCVASAAHATDCTGFPNTLQNGTTANADLVMQDFACAGPKGAPFTSTVNISTGTPSNYQLDAQGPGRFMSPNGGTTGAVIIRDAAGNPNAAYIQFVNNANTGQYGFIKGLSSGGLNLAGGNIGVNTDSPSYTFYVNGSAGGASAWYNLSDERMKKNIATLPDALQTVMKLRGVSYDWRPASERVVGKTLDLPTDKPQVGFIAQEVEKVIPQAVRPASENSEGIYGLEETKVIPFLVEAIKEQQKEIADLQRRLGKTAK